MSQWKCRRKWVTGAHKLLLYCEMCLRVWGTVETMLLFFVLFNNSLQTFPIVYCQNGNLGFLLLRGWPSLSTASFCASPYSSRLVSSLLKVSWLTRPTSSDTYGVFPIRTLLLGPVPNWTGFRDLFPTEIQEKNYNLKKESI